MMRMINVENEEWWEGWMMTRMDEENEKWWEWEMVTMKNEGKYWEWGMKRMRNVNEEWEMMKMRNDENKKSGNWGLDKIDCHRLHKGQCTLGKENLEEI